MEARECLFIFFLFFFPDFSFSENALSLLWEEEDIEVRKALTGYTTDEYENEILIKRLSQLPFTEEVKSRAWYKLVRSETLKNFTVKDLSVYRSLVPHVPLRLLRTANFDDEFILEYLRQIEFDHNHLALIADALVENWGPESLTETKILRMGNFFCGLSEQDMKKINGTVLRILLQKNFFNKLYSCNHQQIEILSNSMQSYSVLGPARHWRPEIVELAGILVAGLSPRQFRELSEACMAYVKPEVINKIPVSILKELKLQQIKALSRTSLLTWRRRTQDLRLLYSDTHSLKPIIMLIVMAYICSNVNVYMFA